MISQDGSDVQRRTSFEIDCVNVGAARQKEFYRRVVAAESGVVKGRVAVVVADVDVTVVRKVE